MPYQGQFVVRRLSLAHSTFTSNLESLRTPIKKMHKAMQKVENEVILGAQGSPNFIGNITIR